MPTGGPPSTHQEWVIIPPNMRGWISQHMGYSGPWRVRRSEAMDYIRAYQAAHEGEPSDDGGPSPSYPSPGGSGGGGYAGMSPKQKANLRNSYLKMLQDFDMDITKNLNNLMNQGVNQEWSTTSFLIHLRRTADYKQHFPGIMGAEGVRNEAQYNAQYKQFFEEAKAAGFKLSRTQFGTLYKKDVRAGEWQLRVEFLKRAKHNPQFFNTIEAVARARGIIKPKEQLSKKELYHAMLHKGNPKIEGLLEEANVSHQLQSIGFLMGPKGIENRKMVTQFIKQMETQGFEVESFTREQFAGLADKLRTVLPAAEQIGAGISKQDLFVLEFGGKGQEEIARQAQAILKSVEQADQKRVKPALVEDETGSRLLGGSSQAPKAY